MNTQMLSPCDLRLLLVQQKHVSRLGIHGEHQGYSRGRGALHTWGQIEESGVYERCHVHHVQLVHDHLNCSDRRVHIPKHHRWIYFPQGLERSLSGPNVRPLEASWPSEIHPDDHDDGFCKDWKLSSVAAATPFLMWFLWLLLKDLSTAKNRLRSAHATR
jgi:hypothetical protein